MRAKRKSDREIQQDVQRELSWDARVGPTEVGIQVKDGVVTLSGTVDETAKVAAAAEVAHRAPSVLDVVNELVVRSKVSAAG